MNTTSPERESISGLKTEPLGPSAGRPSTFEMLAAIASGQGEVWEQARAMIGTGQLALLMVKTALNDTTESPSPIQVERVLGMSISGASSKIANIAVRS
jgi:hypothetical protein